MAAKRDISVAGTSDNSISSTCLSSLPPELQTQIFKQLDGATATCLGLTCKHLWIIFKLVRQTKFTLGEYAEITYECSTTFIILGELLKTWMLPRIYASKFGLDKFVTQRAVLSDEAEASENAAWTQSLWRGEPGEIGP
ncbi:hypothetical protein L207DRAFT_590449 [Hyaloscypha variabilis F]|uniref:F-box domain-containing protein n=1 Tax=Hyaloscypha variabilis (strain UAMH 11265 / GT02V1 / F) TaxID=1149755 RepID=A0A2J6R2L2_HYAVF|nr:hypothetical protein L207DRAFT_590449 [Hyaloscypha variabilis F]